MSTQVLLVNELDQPLELMDKLEAHQNGQLHRAFSIFIFNSKNQFILQQRADHKYHAGGLWTNTCCSHPLSEENLITEAKERLMEEMGMEVDFLEESFSFTYRAEFENGLIEHEYDHVLVGFSDLEPNLNPQEVKNWKAIYFEDLDQEVQNNPDQFTPWFKMIYERVFAKSILDEDVDQEKNKTLK